jgi:hypothetical protein
MPKLQVGFFSRIARLSFEILIWGSPHRKVHTKASLSLQITENHVLIHTSAMKLALIVPAVCG